MGTTATGTAGANTIAVGSAAGLQVGMRVQLDTNTSQLASVNGTSNIYTITAISGTTITLDDTLSQTYGGVTLYGGHVSQLADKSGNGANGTQGTAAVMPLWISNGQNGNGVINLNGTQYMDSTPNLNNAAGGYNSVFFTMNWNGTQGRMPFGSTSYDIYITGGGFGFNTGESNVYGISNGDLSGAWRQFDAVFYNGPMTGHNKLYMQGQSQTLSFILGSDSNRYISDSLRIGGWTNSTSYRFTGRLSEFAIFNIDLGSNSRDLVTQYQSAKWGITLTGPGVIGSEVGLTGAEAQTAMASTQAGATTDGYSVFAASYLNRLSQSSDIILQASNNINLDLQGATLTLAAGRNITLTAGNQILTASTGGISTSQSSGSGGNIAFNATNGIVFNNTFALNSGGGNINLNNAVTLNSDLTANAGSGTLSFGSTVNGAYNLTATAGTFSLGGTIGGTTPLGSFSLTSTNALTLPSISAASIYAETTASTSGITLASNKALIASGIGSVLRLKAAESIILNSGSSLTTPSGGNVVLWSNASNLNAGNIQMTGSQITSNGGNVTLAGGLDDGANAGTAGDGVPDNYAWGTSASTAGVRISGSNVVLNSGKASFYGHGYSSSPSPPVGVYMTGGSVVQTSTGNVVLKGIAGNGAGADEGVYLVASSVRTQSGSIQITGTSGSGQSGDTPAGIRMDSNAEIASTGTGEVGEIELNGYGQLNSSLVSGVYLCGGRITTVDANVTINGYGNSSSSYFGIYFASTNSLLSTGRTNYLITGSGHLFDIRTWQGGHTHTIGGLSALGDITLVANQISLNGDFIAAQTAGSITVKPRTASTTVGINGGAGTLAMTATLLSSFHPGTALIIGDATSATGAVTINGWDLRGKAYDVSVYGGPITFASGGVLWDNANDLYFRANTGNIAIGQPFTKSGGALSALTFVAAGNIADAAMISAAPGSPFDLLYSAGGYIYDIASINTYGGDLVMRSNNADVPVTSTTFNAIDIQNATIQTGGGDIILGGGSSSDEDGNPNGYANSSGLRGVYLNADTINAGGGGNITIKGMASSGVSAIYFASDMITTEESGAIAVNALHTNGNHGLSIGNSSISSASGAVWLNGIAGSSALAVDINFVASSSIYSSSGDIMISGTGGAANKSGISFSSGTYRIYSSSGDVTLVGAGHGTGNDFVWGTTQYIGTDGSETTTNGVVELISNGVGNFTTSASTTLASLNTIKITATGNISILNPINGFAGNPVKVIMSAGGYIRDAASINTYGGDLVMRSNNADVVSVNTTYSAIDISSATLQTGGGDLVLGGGSASDGNGYPTGYASSSGKRGIYIYNSTLNGAGGNISILGRASTNVSSVKINNSTVSTTGIGSVTVQGIQTGTNSVGLSVAGSTVSTGSGFISLSGAGNSATGGGLGFEGGNSNIFSVSGDITLTGTGISGARGLWFTSGYTYKIYSASGDITLIASATGTADFIQEGTQYLGTNGSGTTTTGDVLIRAVGMGGFTLPASTTIAVSGEGNISIDAGSGAFVNNKGVNALTLGMGRWLVYSANPSGDTFGGLNSDNAAVWNAAYGDTISQAGNRYVFAYQPTLTITSTGDTKAYGNDATAQLAGDFMVTGYNEGIANAYLADNAFTALSGAPFITSAGSGASANIGSYAIAAAQGSLVSPSGYALTYISSGSLSTQPRALTVIANNKTIYAGMPNVFYAGMNNLIAHDVPLISWTYAPQGYEGLPGTYEITALASDPQNRLANYTITYVSGTLTADALPSTVVTNMQLPLSNADVTSGSNIADNSAFGADGGSERDRDAYTPSAHESAPSSSMNDTKSGRHIEIKISPALQKLLGFRPKIF
jgi:hypothetical protein